MRIFKEREFIILVNNMFKSIEHTTSNAQVKHQIAQVCNDNNFDYKDVITYIYNLWMGTHSGFTSRYNNLNWDNVFKHYIKEAEHNYDWAFAKQLSDIVGSISSKGTKRNSELHNLFFNFIKEQGLDEEILKMDMTLDIWGWMKTIDLLLSKAVDVSKDDISKTPTKERPAANAVESKLKMTRKRHQYVEIKQYTTDKTFIKSWKSIGEAAKELNLNHASISKCLSGTYKTTGGFIWEGIEAETLETAA